MDSKGYCWTRIDDPEVAGLTYDPIAIDEEAPCTLVEFIQTEPVHIAPPSSAQNGDVLLVKRITARLNKYGRERFGDVCVDVFRKCDPAVELCEISQLSQLTDFGKSGYELVCQSLQNVDSSGPMTIDIPLPGRGYVLERDQWIRCLGTYFGPPPPTGYTGQPDTDVRPRFFCEIEVEWEDPANLQAEDVMVPVRFPRSDQFQRLSKRAFPLDPGFPYEGDDPQDLFTLCAAGSASCGDPLGFTVDASYPQRPDLDAICPGDPLVFFSKFYQSHSFRWHLKLEQFRDEFGASMGDDMWCDSFKAPGDHHLLADVEFPTRSAVDFLRAQPISWDPAVTPCLEIAGGAYFVGAFHSEFVRMPAVIQLYLEDDGSCTGLPGSFCLGDQLALESGASSYPIPMGSEQRSQLLLEDVFDETDLSSVLRPIDFSAELLNVGALFETTGDINGTTADEFVPKLRTDPPIAGWASYVFLLPIACPAP